MATKKSKPAPKAKPAARSKANAAPVPSAAPRKGVRKEWVIALVFLAIVAAVAGQVVYMAKKKAAQKLEFMRVGALVQKGASEGQCSGARGMAPAKDGGFYHLDGEAPNWRLQQFKRDGSYVGRYKPANAKGILNRPSFMTTGDDGKVYVLDRDGKIVVLGPDMKQLDAISIPTVESTSMAVNAAGELFVLNNPQQRIDVYDAKGRVLRTIGDGADPKGALASPISLFLSKPDDTLYVYEAPAGKARVKVFSPEGAYQRSFFVQVKVSPYSTFGVDPEGRVYFSQLDAGTGVQVYDTKGKYIGASKSSVDNQMYPDQGYLTVNPWNGEVIMNYAPAVGYFRFQVDAE